MLNILGRLVKGGRSVGDIALTYLCRFRGSVGFRAGWSRLLDCRGVIHILCPHEFRRSLNPSLVEGFNLNLEAVELAYPWNLGFEVGFGLSYSQLISLLLDLLFDLLSLLLSFLCLYLSLYCVIPNLLHGVLGFQCTNFFFKDSICPLAAANWSSALRQSILWSSACL